MTNIAIYTKVTRWGAEQKEVDVFDALSRVNAGMWIFTHSCFIDENTTGFYFKDRS